MRSTSRPLVRWALSTVLLGVALLACGDDSSSETCDPLPALPAAPCAAGYFLYQDQSCGLAPPDASVACSEAGDGLCHQQCTTDADCTDPCRPFCRTLGLFAGGDFNCNDTITICRETDSSDCTR